MSCWRKLLQLRRRITELETHQKDYEEAGSELKNARQRFEYLLAFSPAIIYTTQASGGLRVHLCQREHRSIMGYLHRRK